MTENNTVMIILGGTLLYPKHENGRFECSLVIDPIDYNKIVMACKQKNGALAPVKMKTDKNTGESYVTLKSKYSIKVIDKDSNPVEEPLRHGAQVRCRISIAEYTYQRKKGLALYLNSVLLEKNGEGSKQLSANDFYDDGLPF